MQGFSIDRKYLKKNVLSQFCQDPEQVAEATTVLQKHSPMNPELG